MVTFAHPFDLHYTTQNIYGWPKIIIRLWKLDETNKVDLVSYGCCTLPNTAGFHEIEFDSWMLKGTLQQETLGFFLGKFYIQFVYSICIFISIYSSFSLILIYSFKF